jgi:hypothetical protein
MASQAQFTTVAPSGSDQHWRVPASTSAQLILSASQDGRVHGSIFNDSGATLFLSFGGSNVAVVGQFDVKITSASYFELPKPAVYQGEIWGVWDATGGWAHVLHLGVPK